MNWWVKKEKKNLIARNFFKKIRCVKSNKNINCKEFFLDNKMCKK